MVTAIVNRQKARRVVRIAEDLIEINHPIVLACDTYPIVDHLPLLLILRREEREWGSRNEETFEWIQSGAVDFDASRVRTLDKLPIPWII